MVFPDPNITYDIRSTHKGYSVVKWYITDHTAVLFNEQTCEIQGYADPKTFMPRTLGDVQKVTLTKHFKERVKERFGTHRDYKNWVFSFWNDLKLSKTQGDTDFYVYKNIEVLVKFLPNEVILTTVYPIRESELFNLENDYQKELVTIKRKNEFDTVKKVLGTVIKDIDQFVLDANKLTATGRKTPKLERLDELLMVIEKIVDC